MASTNASTTAVSDPPSPNTTFIQADPSTFRIIVQKLTGPPNDPSAQKLPVTHSSRPLPIPAPKRPGFNLNERRQSAKNLQINLVNTNCIILSSILEHSHDLFQLRQQRGGNNFMVSPVSTLEFVGGRMSPGSPAQSEELWCSDEEERAIAEKKFYLHPISRLSSFQRAAKPPELLPLFPLGSPNSADDVLHDRGRS